MQLNWTQPSVIRANPTEPNPATQQNVILVISAQLESIKLNLMERKSTQHKITSNVTQVNSRGFHE